MPEILGLAFLVVVGLVVWGFITVYNSQQSKHKAVEQSAVAEAITKALWVDVHRIRGDKTEVLVQQVAHLPTGDEVLQSQVVKSFPSDDPEWHEKFDAAVIEAADRANALNTPSLNG
jgi:hypothetical protein